MGAAQTGDRIAYRQLLDALRGWLSRYYRRRLPPGQVDDAVQDALLAIHLKRHTYDPVRPFGPWLAAIARYKWIDRLRAMRATIAEPLPEDLSVPDDGNAVISALVIDQLLGSLKPAQAAAVRLVKLQGRSIADAAALTGQTRALVKVNIHRGLAKLAAQVDEFAHAR